MTSHLARFGGLVLFVIAIAAGVLLGRVIEAIAVGAVLFTLWTYIARLVGGPTDEPSQRRDDPIA